MTGKGKKTAVLSWSFKYARDCDVPHPGDFEDVREVG